MDEKELEKDILEESTVEDELDKSEDDDDDDDIEFDDNINIEALTQQLQQHIEIDPSEIEIENDETSESAVTASDGSSETSEPVQEDEVEDIVVPEPEPEPLPEPVELTETKQLSPLDDFPKDICKKYVVYIMPDNVDFVDSLSIDERNRLINNVIYDKHVADKKNNVLQERKNYIKHLIVTCFTIIVGFPLMFFIVNKSLQASISNYEQSQKNFEKLYKEKGKIVNYQNLEAQQ